MEPAPRAHDAEPDWRWQALFAVPDGFDAPWRALLALSQKAEDAAILTYWANRSRTSRRGE